MDVTEFHSSDAVSTLTGDRRIDYHPDQHACSRLLRRRLRATTIVRLRSVRVQRRGDGGRGGERVVPLGRSRTQAITVSIPAGSVHSGGNGIGAETPVCVLLWSFPSLEVSMHYQKDGEQDPWSILTINSSFESCTITMGFVEFLFSVLNDLELNRGNGTQKHNSEAPVVTRHASSSLYPDDTLVIQDNPRCSSAIP